jgi:hypothetical protein
MCIQLASLKLNAIFTELFSAVPSAQSVRQLGCGLEKKRFCGPGGSVGTATGLRAGKETLLWAPVAQSVRWLGYGEEKKRLCAARWHSRYGDWATGWKRNAFVGPGGSVGTETGLRAGKETLLWSPAAQLVQSSCFVKKPVFTERRCHQISNTPKPEHHSLSGVRDCLFNILASTLHIGGRSSIRKLGFRWGTWGKETNWEIEAEMVG